MQNILVAPCQYSELARDSEHTREQELASLLLSVSSEIWLNICYIPFSNPFTLNCLFLYTKQYFPFILLTSDF